MSGHPSVEGFYHLARDTAESDKQTKIKNKRRPKSFASTAPQYFVPAFGVRRQVFSTEEVREFMRQLTEALPRNYRVLSPQGLAMTIIEQGRLVKRFRQAELHPTPKQVEQLADRTKLDLRQSLHGIPRRLILPTGTIDRFGEEGKKNKIGIVPNGWKGFGAHYAEQDGGKQVLPMPVIVRETNLCLGGLITTFGDKGELERGIRVDGLSRTPHITLARKEKGGPISQSELHSLSSVIEEIMPDTLELFDPVIYMQLKQSQEEPIMLYSRPTRFTRHAPYLQLLPNAS